jgi:hypothetical protein
MPPNPPCIPSSATSTQHTHFILAKPAPPPTTTSSAASANPHIPPWNLHRLVLVAARTRIIFHARSNSKNLEHPCGSAAENDDSQHDDDEHGRSHHLRIGTFESCCKCDTNSSSQTSPEEHHLVRMRQLLVPLPSNVFVEKVDALR